MKRGGTMLVWLACSLALCAAATARTAAAADNPYQAVVERNVFGLKPPPPPPDPEATKPPLPKITLTGIITVGGAKRVLLKTPPLPGPPKAGEPPRTEQGFILAVGEREGEIEVLEIDEKAGSVKVNYGGTVTDLTFEKDGVKTSSTPAPGALAAPGAPPPTRRFPPGARGAPGTGATPIPGRWPRTPGEGGRVTPQAAAGAGLPGVAGVNPAVMAQSTAAQDNSSPEANILLLELNRIKTQPLVDAGLLPPLPPQPEETAAVQSLLADPAPAATPTTAPAPVTLPLPPGSAQPFPPQAPQ